MLCYKVEGLFLFEDCIVVILIWFFIYFVKLMCGIGFIYVLVDVSGLVFDCIFMIMEFDGMFIIVC